ncbi:MAG: hypothetical protein IT384_27375 [Deltaproteobacteria bacterium]|nr:hypothetical protein [Deltaproteobacteria bacterium]
MRIVRQYTCDFGHRWHVKAQHDDAERPEDARCPEGHEAITRRDQEPADEVQIVLRPATRVLNQRTGSRILEGKYWLVLLDRVDAEVCTSTEMYGWDEIIKLSNLFRGKSVAEALKWWERRKP